MEDKTNIKNFFEILETPYEKMASICMLQFKNLIDNENYKEAKVILDWVKYSFQKENDNKV